ncbi:MAG TPA: hypothetical protein VHE35_33990, partial [Kofleriaceae bacterium]|nr:hypothetical protein [Kofleriaceae bacterium]
MDAVKAHALGLSVGSPRAERGVLVEYLLAEESAEALALGHALDEAARAGGHGWVERLLAAQLADEARHARLLRARLAEL